MSIREVVLKSKPEALLALGGRSTVPQLIDIDGLRYPESLDIIFWALHRAVDKELAGSIWPTSKRQQHKIRAWLNYNDNRFKYWLDRYKYADRFPELNESDYRDKACVFLKRLDDRLSSDHYLMGARMSLADMAIFPFIRQFAAVDRDWFDSSQYHNVKRWLDSFTESNQFKGVVMTKISPWQVGQSEVVFPNQE